MSTAFRTVLVDDEPPARRKLRHLLADHLDFEIVGEAGSGAEAVEVINRLRPDLIFLDVQLPDCSGFDVLECLDRRAEMRMVFVTAFDEFAVRAFDVHAFDYLLKPVEPSRFRRCLERLRESTPSSNVDALLAEVQRKASPVQRLLIQDGSRAFFLDVRHIEWIEAARNYNCIHAGGKTHIVRSSLDALSAKLDPVQFRRINRSEMVNVRCIREVKPAPHGDRRIRLPDGTELLWSRRYRLDSLEELEHS